MTILDSGINLMLYGMGTVFVFLSLLIATTMTMSWCINRFMPQSETVSSAPKAAQIQPNAKQIDPKLLSVLQAAIDARRKT